MSTTDTLAELERQYSAIVSAVATVGPGRVRVKPSEHKPVAVYLDNKSADDMALAGYGNTWRGLPVYRVSTATTHIYVASEPS